MKKFQYKNNKVNPPEIMAEIFAENIIIADQEFLKQLKIEDKQYLIKNPWIGCIIVANKICLDCNIPMEIGWKGIKDMFDCFYYYICLICYRITF